jgi:hypothetical protein
MGGWVTGRPFLLPATKSHDTRTYQRMEEGMAADKNNSSFETFIAKERDRLAKQKDDILARQQKLDEEFATVEKELAAIAAYEAVKLGKSPQTKRGSKGGRSGVARGSRLQGVLEVIEKNPAGLSRGEILQALGLKGNKAGEQSVSNALTALKKARRVTAKEGKYTAA